jgi:hypothetical protein
MWLCARTVVFKLAKQFELVVVFILPHPLLVVRGLHGAAQREGSGVDECVAGNVECNGKNTEFRSW